MHLRDYGERRISIKFTRIVKVKSLEFTTRDDCYYGGQPMPPNVFNKYDCGEYREICLDVRLPFIYDSNNQLAPMWVQKNSCTPYSNGIITGITFFYGILNHKLI